jgi:2-polyprenyl-6-hydroxyphenyl methylase/3-demethylubiquinone-9 3-methyltransferase
MSDLTGLTFLDIGCGSGLHAISAAILQANPVYAVDIDADCIETTRQTAQRFLSQQGISTDLHIQKISILDPAAVSHLPQSDIVYSWGVLHHTGQMYRAIEVAARLTKPGGLYVIAIYNRHLTSPAWRGIKWTYNRSAPVVQQLMYWLFYGIIYFAKWAVTRDNPLRKARGMDFHHDVIDWIGGYPYEYASIDEIVQFVTRLGFNVKRVVPTEVGTGCNEFVFRRATLTDAAPSR